MTTFHDLLRSSAEHHAGRTAVIFDEERLTYEALLSRSESLSASLVERDSGQDANALAVVAKLHVESTDHSPAAHQTVGEPDLVLKVTLLRLEVMHIEELAVKVAVAYKGLQTKIRHR